MIYSNPALHWAKDHRHLLKNVYQALKSGGIVRLNFAGEGDCVHFFEVIRKTIPLDGFKTYFKNFFWPWYMRSVNAYGKLAQESGLKDGRVWGKMRTAISRMQIP